MASDSKWLEKLEVKIDKQDERIDKIDITLTEIKADLKEHMRRTAANEESNELLKKHIDLVQKESNTRLAKLEKIKDNFHFLGWLLGGILGVAETAKHFNLF